MPFIIYIKSTKHVVGRVWKETQIPGELQNIANSELGGIPSDYGVTPNAPEKTTWNHLSDHIDGKGYAHP